MEWVARDVNQTPWIECMWRANSLCEAILALKVVLARHLDYILNADNKRYNTPSRRSSCLDKIASAQEKW